MENSQLSKTSVWMGIIVSILTLLVEGCGGLETLPSSARAGDTIVLATGWKQGFDRNQLTVEIVDPDGITTYQYLPNDPAIRAVVNLYPDPVSWLVTSTRTGSAGSSGFEYLYGNWLNANWTNNDPDWFQTTVFLDLPATMNSTGTAYISFSSTGGETYGPVPVEIIPGAGSPAIFNAQGTSYLNQDALHSLERADHQVVTFSSTTTTPIFPAAIEVTLLHNTGIGNAFVINPRGETKNLFWSDDGTTLKVIMLASGDGTWLDPNLNNMLYNYYKFYITGGITGVIVQNVNAYDKNGNTLPQITASVE
jgi:hypothetical protein